MLQNSEKIIRHKVGLLNLGEELGNVSKACQVMGLSRNTFYRYKAAVEDGGLTKPGKYGKPGARAAANPKLLPDRNQGD